ncbi:MAG: hypothetical protein AB7F86_11025 [Bdellovibrionales bacterium]
MIATGLLFFSLLFTNAHNIPLDELGCHSEPPGSGYHCHAGTLEGRDFASREEAERALKAVTAGANSKDFQVSFQKDPNAPVAEAVSAVEATPDSAKASRSVASIGLPPPPEPEKAVLNENLLNVITWNIRRSGGTINYDRIVNILAEADISIIQEIDLDEKGKGPLHIIGDLIEGRIHQKICRAWFRNPTNGREKYGILWRNSTVAHVEKNGSVRPTCGEMATVIPLKAKKHAQFLVSTLFMSKVQRKAFQLASVNLATRPKKPKTEIPSYFRDADGGNWPTLFAGHFGMSFRDRSFDEPKKSGFKPVVQLRYSKSTKGRGSKLIPDNLWVKGAVVVRAVPINLYDRFSDIKPKMIEQEVSNFFPILAEIALQPEPDEKILGMIAKSKKAASKTVAEKKTKPEPKVVNSKPKKDFVESKDDIEEEANEADVEHRDPANASKKSGTKKKKKTPAEPTGT